MCWCVGAQAVGAFSQHQAQSTNTARLLPIGSLFVAPLQPLDLWVVPRHAEKQLRPPVAAAHLNLDNFPHALAAHGAVKRLCVLRSWLSKGASSLKQRAATPHPHTYTAPQCTRTNHTHTTHKHTLKMGLPITSPAPISKVRGSSSLRVDSIV